MVQGSASGCRLTWPRPRAIVMHPMQTTWERRFLSLGALLGAALILGGAAGCVRVEQTLTLNADGSGVLAIRYGMAEADLAQVESMARGQLAEEGLPAESAVNPFEFDEAEVRKDFEAYREWGVTLEQMRTEVVEGWKYLSMRMAFTSLAGLGRTEFLSDRQITLKKVGEGRFELVQGAPPGAEAAEMEVAPDLMAEMMKGFRAELRVEVPGAIVESNADEQTPRRATWIFDVDRDAKALQRAQRLAMRVVFEAPGLALPDYASPVSEE